MLFVLESHRPSSLRSLSLSLAPVAILLLKLFHMARQTRPDTVLFDVAAFGEQMATCARLRNPGWHWDASDYDKVSRNATADRKGLKTYLVPLQVLLGLAPTGFPSQNLLRQGFERRHQAHSIFP